jgi:predicted PurR-regulated permease PerM
VHVDEHVVDAALEPRKRRLGLLEERVGGVDVEVALQAHDPQADAVALDDGLAAPRLRAQEVRGAHDPVSAPEVGDDLAAAEAVVAERDHVDAGLEQLVGDARGDAQAARDVLRVDDDEGRLVPAPELGQQPEQRPPPRAADEVAGEEDGRGGVGHGAYSRARPPMSAVPPDTPPPLPPDGPRPPAPVVVPRWVQLVALPLLVLGLYTVARAAGNVLLIFAIAGVVALILQPLVAALQAARLSRGMAIAVVYLGLLCVLVVLGLLLANPVASQVDAFRKDVPSLVDDANRSLADLQRTFDDKGIDIEVKRQGETALETLQGKVTTGTGDVVSFGTGLLETIVTAGFALIVVVVLSIYLLLYGPRIGAGVRAVMPPGAGTPDDDFPTRVIGAVAGYVRGQVLFSLAMGTGAAIGLWLFGVLGIFPDGQRYALVFGAFFGLMELIPYLGPFLGATPPILVALLGDPLTGLWVALLFVAIQQLEGHVVAPLVFGHALRINPILVILALLLGGELAGIVGALVALPILAVLRETVVYLRQHLVLEPWGPADAVVLDGAAHGPVVEDEREREHVG